MKLRAIALLAALAALAPLALAGEAPKERPGPEKRVAELKKTVLEAYGEEQVKAIDDLGAITDEKLLTDFDIPGFLAKKVFQDVNVSPQARLAAVRALGRVLVYAREAKPAVLPPLLTRLADNNDSRIVRRGLADMLGNLLKADDAGDANAFQVLERLARDRSGDDKTVPAACLRALGSAGYPKAAQIGADVLLDRGGGQDLDVKAAALEAIENIFKKIEVRGDLDNVLRALTALVGDEAAPLALRARAAAALAATVKTVKDPAVAAGPLSEALDKTTDPRLAASLAEAMARVPHESCIKSLQKTYEAFAKSKDPEAAQVRKTVARTLGAYFVPLAKNDQLAAGQGAAELLLTIARKDANGEVQRAAVYSLGNFCSRKYDRARAAGELIEFLAQAAKNQKDLAEGIRASLSFIIDRDDLGENPDDWKKWYEANKGALGPKS